MVVQTALSILALLVVVLVCVILERRKFSSASPRRSALGLLALLGALAALYAGREALRGLPHEPRLYLANESLGAVTEWVIRSDCGDVRLPPLAEGQRVRLPITPRPECRYEIHRTALEGGEVVRLVELARRERADVAIEVGIDYVHINLVKARVSW
jgi:hypothetical protein